MRRSNKRVKPDRREREEDVGITYIPYDRRAKTRRVLRPSDFDIGATEQVLRIKGIIQIPDDGEELRVFRVINIKENE